MGSTKTEFHRTHCEVCCKPHTECTCPADLAHSGISEERKVLMRENAAEQRANERQVGGSHYKDEIQHWDYAAANNFDYFQGQITKYIHRWRRKNGLQDLQKARHFLDKYIEEVEAGRISSNFVRFDMIRG